MDSNNEQKRKIEEKKYKIEVSHIHKQWNREYDLSNYLEEKFGKCRDSYRVSEEEYQLQEYIDMYDLQDLYYSEEGEE